MMWEKLSLQVIRLDSWRACDVAGCGQLTPYIVRLVHPDYACVCVACLRRLHTQAQRHGRSLWYYGKEVL